MPNAAGDIVTVLSLEDFEFRTGLRNGSAAAKTFGKDVEAAGAKVSGAGGLGRGISQMGFAMQDFSSVLSMGGKNALSRALMGTMNNVQMLGAAFGPWGMAVTAVGGALGSVLIPKLLEGESAFERIATATQESTDRMLDFISRGKEMISFQASLGKMEGEAPVKQKREELATRRDQAQFEKDALLTQAQRIREQLQSVRKAKEDAHGSRDFTEIFTNPQDYLFEPRKFYGDLGGAINNVRDGLNSTIESLEKQLDTVDKKAVASAQEIGQIEKQQGMLTDIEPTAKNKGFAAEFAIQQGKDLDAIEKMRKKRLTPLEKMQAGITDLSLLSARMPGNEHIVAAGMDTLFEEFAKAIPKAEERLSPAMLKGSSEALSAINKASVGDDSRKQQLEQAKKAVDLAKDQLTALKAIEGKVERVVPVALGGG